MPKAATGTKATDKGAVRKANPALMKPLQPSEALAAVVGSKPLPRPEVVTKVWDYIKKHKLQNPQNKREIMATESLRRCSARSGHNVRDEQASGRAPEVALAVPFGVRFKTGTPSAIWLLHGSEAWVGPEACYFVLKHNPATVLAPRESASRHPTIAPNHPDPVEAAARFHEGPQDPNSPFSFLRELLVPVYTLKVGTQMRSEKEGLLPNREPRTGAKPRAVHRSAGYGRG